MAKYIKIFLVSLCILFMSCQSGKLNRLTGKDSSEIITAALDSRSFIKDQKPSSDTLYLLKPKHFNKSWPAKTAGFRIIYIDDTTEAQTVNVPWRAIDKRIRIGVPIFNLEKDSVILKLYEFGGKAGYNYKFIKKNNVWVVATQNNTID